MATGVGLTSVCQKYACPWALVLCQLTDAWIVFDAQIDMFLNTETEGTSLGEVALLEFVFLDLEATVEDLFGLWSTDSAVA